MAQRQKFSSRRLTWHTAIAPSFPTEKQLEFMKDHFKIQLLRFCSVPGADGALEAIPRKISAANWGQQKVQVLFRRTDNGAREEQWALFFSHLNYEPFPGGIPRHATKQLWKQFADMYQDDARSVELCTNVLTLVKQTSRRFGGGGSSEDEKDALEPSTQDKIFLAKQQAANKNRKKNMVPQNEGVLTASIAAGELPPFESFDWKTLGGGAAAANFMSSLEFSEGGAAPGGDSPWIPMLEAEPAEKNAVEEPQVMDQNDAGESGVAEPPAAGESGVAEPPAAGESGAAEPPAAEEVEPAPAPESPAPAQPRRNLSRTPAFLQQLQRTPINSVVRRAGFRRAVETPPAACGLFRGGESSEESDGEDPLPPAARHARRGLFSAAEGQGDKKRAREDLFAAEEEEERLKRRGSPPPPPAPKKAPPPPPAPKRPAPAPPAPKKRQRRGSPPKKRGPGTLPAAQGRRAAPCRMRASPSPEKEEPVLPPPPPLYEALFREFLALGNVYSRGKGGCTRDINMLGVLRALLTREVYQHPDHRSFFDIKNRAGLGLLYPGKEEPGGDPKAGASTLELHRRALRLECAGEGLLSTLRDAVRGLGEGKIACLVTKADRDDLEAAFRFHGGIAGKGVEYWMGKPEPNMPRIPGAFPEQASLGPALCIMQRLRPTAMTRSYLVIDECSWGLPIAVKILLARRHAAERGRSVDAADLRHAVADLNTWRRQAVVNDRAALVKYGLKLSEYCRRLEAITRSLGVHVAPCMSLRDGGVLAFDERALRAEAGAKPELTGKRIKEESAELRDALTALGLVSSPAAEQIHRIRSAVISAMAADSHQCSATSKLHPSPSMPDAVYSPASYDRALAGGGGGA